jgi:hypothetical protein
MTGAEVVPPVAPTVPAVPLSPEFPPHPAVNSALNRHPTNNPIYQRMVIASSIGILWFDVFYSTPIFLMRQIFT